MIRCFVSVAGKQNENEDSWRRKSEIKKHSTPDFVLMRKFKRGFIFFLAKMGSTITTIIYGELKWRTGY